MTVELALWTRLQAVSAVTALVADRVYDRESTPQNPTYPYVTFELISTVHYPTFGDTTGIRKQRFQFDAYGAQQFTAAGVIGAAEVGAAVRAALQRYRGSVAGVTFQDIELEREEDPEPDLSEGPAGEGLGRRSLDFLVSWE